MALLTKNNWLPTIPALLLLLFCCSIAYGQEEELVLDNSDAYTEKQRVAVTFPHELHMGELECLECHHDYDEDGENVLDEDLLEEGNEDLLCSACHDIDLKEAFHGQCMGCHRQLRISGSGIGPELCGECHIK